MFRGIFLLKLGDQIPECILSHVSFYMQRKIKSHLLIGVLHLVVRHLQQFSVKNGQLAR